VSAVTRYYFLCVPHRLFFLRRFPYTLVGKSVGVLEVPFYDPIPFSSEGTLYQRINSSVQLFVVCKLREVCESIFSRV